MTSYIMDNFFDAINDFLSPLAEEQREGTWEKEDSLISLYTSGDRVGVFAAGHKRRLLDSILEAMEESPSFSSLIMRAAAQYRKAHAPEKQQKKSPLAMFGKTKKLLS